jgi:hypothetical protein
MFPLAGEGSLRPHSHPALRATFSRREKETAHFLPLPGGGMRDMPIFSLSPPGRGSG